MKTKRSRFMSDGQANLCAALVALALSTSWVTLEGKQARLTLTIDRTLDTARILDGVPRPKPVAEVAPVYPANLPAAFEGTVTVKIKIGKDGAVKDAHIVTHSRQWFDDSAIASARQARYDPAKINGAPVEIVFNRTVTFPKNRGTITVSDLPPVIEVPSPKLAKQVDPQPPSGQVPVGVRGRVLVEVVIGDSGKVKTAQILKGLSPDIDQTVLNAVRQWVFEQTMVNGLAMEVITVVTINAVS